MKKERKGFYKYFWDLNEKALGETADILKSPAHTKFRSRMVKLLSRCQDPGELFSVISKEDFVGAWPALRRYWSGIEKISDFRDWWQTVYEELLARGPREKNPYRGSSPILKAVGKSVRQARVDKNMSQKGLALATGMKQPDISKIEEGKKNITLETLGRVCAALGIETISLKAEA